MKITVFLITTIVTIFISKSVMAVESYPFVCMGPLNYQIAGAGGTLAIKIKKNLVAGGAEGQGLRPGTCAWVDRAVSSNEPNIAAILAPPNYQFPEVISAVKAVMAQAAYDRIFKLVTDALKTRNAVVKFNAFNVSGTSLAHAQLWKNEEAQSIPDYTFEFYNQ